MIAEMCESLNTLTTSVSLIIVVSASLVFRVCWSSGQLALVLSTKPPRAVNNSAGSFQRNGKGSKSFAFQADLKGDTAPNVASTGLGIPKKQCPSCWSLPDPPWRETLVAMELAPAS